jgi:hypothetical protein
MPARDQAGRLPAAAFIAAIVVAIVVFAAELVDGRSGLGPLALPVLLIPGLALAVALGASPRRWPERLITGAALVLVVGVLTGIVASLSSRGLNAETVAAIELLVLGVAAVIWVWRRPRTAPPVGSARLGPASTSRQPTAAGAGSVAMVVLGILIGAAGFAVATRSAQAQDVAEVLQFWSVPGAGGHTDIGIDDRSTSAVTCTVTISRVAHQPVAFQVGALAPGQQWLGQLPPADPAEVGSWHLLLSCTASSGQLIQRSLTVGPPR